MPRLPIPGSDNGTWGDILNEFLLVEHNADGTQKTLDIAKGGTGATDASTARSNLGAISSSDAQALVDTHSSDTTSVHGITDTSILETTTGSQSKVDAHSADTTSIHGITDTSQLETTTGAQAKADAKVSDTTYGAGWDGDTTTAPSKNAVYDKIEALGVYQTYAPTITQGATNPTTSASQTGYIQTGKMVHCWGRVVLSSAGSTASGDDRITVTLPVQASGNYNMTTMENFIGVGVVHDAGTIFMPALVTLNSNGSPSSIAFVKTNGDVESHIGNTPNFALASGDRLSWDVLYEAA